MTPPSATIDMPKTKDRRVFFRKLVVKGLNGGLDQVSAMQYFEFQMTDVFPCARKLDYQRIILTALFSRDKDRMYIYFIFI